MGSDIVSGLRFAWRSTKRSPGFALTVIATLGLGIGVNATMFSVVDRLLLQPPAHVEDADQVVQVYFDRVSPFTDRPVVSTSASYPDYQDLVGLTGFSEVAGYGGTTLTLGSGESAERVKAQLAAGNLFTLLGVRPHLGRFFGPEEEVIDAPEPATVLSYGFWTRRFGGDPGVIGSEVRLGGGRYTVVGVAPPGFTGPILTPVDVWVPLTTAQAISSGTAWQNARRWFWMAVVARLADGSSVVAAEAEATAAHRAGRAELVEAGQYDSNASVALGSIVPGRALNAGGEVAVTRWLAGVALIVLLIACANVANLLLVRGVRWRRELAIRRALGISERSLRTVLLTEVAVLAAFAGMAALVSARIGGEVLYRTLLPDFAGAADVGGVRVMLFTAGAAVLATALAGLLPTVQAARGNLDVELRMAASRSTRTARLRSGLMVAQVAMSVVLLVGAGLFVKSLAEVYSLDLGFDPEGVLVATLETESGTFSEESSRGVQEAAERLAGLPGVAGVATVSLPPMRGLWGRTFRPEGADSLVVAHGPYHYIADADYFGVMRMRVLRGRGLTEADMALASQPVVVLTEDLAAAAFPDGGALGRCIYIGEGEDGEVPCTTVVGVIADHRSTGLLETESPLYYSTGAHPANEGLRVQTLVVRMAEGANGTSDLVRRTLLAAVPSARFASVAPLQDAVDLRARSWRLGAVLFGLFGGLALVVAALGLYALLAFDVAQRKRDLAVRAALGAQASQLFRSVVGRAVGLTGLGIAAGLVVAFALTGSVRDLLFGVETTDPAVFGTAVVTLLLVAVVSTVLPARRAGLVAPAEVLKGE